jgi:hypothetical protein
VDSLEVEEAGEVEETVDAAIVVGKSIVVTASGGCCRVVFRCYMILNLRSFDIMD